ncbi:MAG: hypothetical protein ACREFI_08830 [Stellaceae bacterium]
MAISVGAAAEGAISAGDPASAEGVGGTGGLRGGFGGCGVVSASASGTLSGSDAAGAGP